MPPLPYAQIFLGTVLLALLVAIVLAAYRWGWKAHEAKTLKIVLDAERRVTEAMELARREPLTLDSEWLRRGSGPPGTSGPLPPASSSR